MKKITNISWERANIIVEIEDVFFDESVYINNNHEKYKLPIENNKVLIRTTNLPEGEMLKPGEWKINIEESALCVDESIVGKLETLTRVFKYDKDFYAYIVTFAINDKLELIITTDFMMKNRKYKKKFLIYQGNNFIEKIIILAKILAIKGLNLFYKILNILFYKKKDILFLSENSNVLNNNLKIIYNNVKDNNRTIKKYTKNIYAKNYNFFNIVKEIYAVSKAKYILLDNYTQLLTHINISKKTTIIQTWHAGVGFKAVGYARFGRSGGPHPYLSSHRKYDYIIVDNKNLINIYKEVFGNKEKNFIPCGIPRLNNYLKISNIQKTERQLFDKYPFLKNKKIVLFAPTYRGDGHKDAYYDLKNIDLNKVQEFCKKNNFIFIIKMHPFIKEKTLPYRKYDNITELSNEDIDNLIYISDILVTDYSSCAYEFSLFDRPLIFYRFDKILYEYKRPMHSLKVFTKEQYEVFNTDDLIRILNKLNKININKRFSNIKNYENESINTIVNILSGE